MSETIKQTEQYTDEQREHMKSRTIHDAKLLTAGAEYDNSGRLVVTKKQLGELASTLASEKLEEFQETLDAQWIHHHATKLHRFQNVVGANNLHYAILARSYPGDRESDLSIGTYREWAEDNELNIDFDGLTADTNKTNDDEKVATKQAMEVVQTAQAELAHLREVLTQYPQYGLGREVTVLRNPRDGKEAYAEKGWQVRNILANGLLRVLSPDQKNTKDVPVDKLQEWAAL